MAFPTTPIIDDFNRADEDPIAAPWVSLAETPTCRVVSNQLALSSGTFGQAYYSTLDKTNIECYATMAVFSGQMSMMFRMQGETDSAKYGYEVISNGTTVVLNTHPFGESGMTLESSATSSVSGDSMGVFAQGNNLEVWYKVGAGDWSLLYSAISALFRNSGRILLQCSDTTGRWDNFGGGDITISTDVTWIGV